MKYPVVDVGKCSLCLGCIEIAPDVFAFDAGLGILRVCDRKRYPEKIVDEAIKNCPEKCIEWEEMKKI